MYKTSKIAVSEVEVEMYITNQYTVDSSTRKFECAYGNYVIKIVYINSLGKMIEKNNYAYA